MSYIVSGHGIIRVMTPEVTDEVLKKLEDSDLFGDVTKENETEIEVNFYNNYHEDEVFEVLASIAYDTDWGVIYCSGEDGSLWKIQYASKDNRWKNYDGRVVYEDEPGYDIY